eukprot:jgi/Mesvir1/23347/Mv21042-RA.1
MKQSTLAAGVLGVGFVVAVATVYATRPGSNEPEDPQTGTCKLALWNQNICLGTSSYLGFPIPADKRPSIPKKLAENVSGDLHAGPFSVAKVLREPSELNARDGIFVLESTNGFIIVNDAQLESEVSPYQSL